MAHEDNINMYLKKIRKVGIGRYIEQAKYIISTLYYFVDKKPI